MDSLKVEALRQRIASDGPCEWACEEGDTRCECREIAQAAVKAQAEAISSVERELASERARRERLEGAIRQHRENVWGKGPVGHEEDVELYKALEDQE